MFKGHWHKIFALHFFMFQTLLGPWLNFWNYFKFALNFQSYSIFYKHPVYNTLYYIPLESQIPLCMLHQGVRLPRGEHLDISTTFVSKSHYTYSRYYYAQHFYALFYYDLYFYGLCYYVCFIYKIPAKLVVIST